MNTTSLVPTTYLRFEKLTEGKQRRDLVSLAGKENLVWLGKLLNGVYYIYWQLDHQKQLSPRRKPTYCIKGAKSLGLKGRKPSNHGSGIYVLPEAPYQGWGDIKGTEHALLVQLSPDQSKIEVWVFEGQKQFEEAFYSRWVDGDELADAMEHLRGRAKPWPTPKGCIVSCFL